MLRSWTLTAFIIIISGLIITGVILSRDHSPTTSLTPSINQALSPTPSNSSQPGASPSPETQPSGISSPQPQGAFDDTSSNPHPDLTTDPNGLSRATVSIKTPEGVIRFKLYALDAPKTVHRFIELIQKGFYQNLTFHRVEPGFVVQGGDPLGNGTGGSGQKLDAEFNNRPHLEGTVAMARAQDPNSADSQFYICLSKLPQLDHNYTVFGQVIEGMDVVKRIKKGDAMLSVVVH